MKRIILALICALMVGAAHAQLVNIKVIKEIPKQKMVSIGGNFCQANYTDHAWDAVGEHCLTEFKPKYVRMALPLQFRGMDYEQYKGDKIVEQPVVIKLMEAMKRMQDEFGVEHFTVSAWRVADELVENPNEQSQRVIKQDAYVDVVDMLKAFLVKLKKDYGVEVDYFSFNEADGGWNTILSPKDVQKLVRMASEKFKAAGLKTEFLLADTAQTLGTVEYASMIMGDSTLWDQFGPLCFHSWWSEYIPDSEFERVAGYAKAWNKPVWCSELGFDAHAHKVKGMNTTWDYGLRFAKISYRMLKYAQVEVSLYWTWQNNYSIMSADTKTKYPSYYVTKQQVLHLNEGTQIFETISADKDVLAISGQKPDGKMVVWVLNMKDEAVELNFDGIDAKASEMISTTEQNNWEELKIKGGKVALKPRSVNSILF